ncbi:MAG TPA: AAA family ATPase [Gemmatimonadaceae bacterium]|nr:AAA family ATPase [Gemmatimonadaceae bacterium]
MADKDTFDELSLLVRARYALIILETREYDRAIAGIERISAELGLHLYAWSRSRGTVRGSHFTDPLVDNTADPAKALAFIREQGAGLFVFRDLAAHFDEPAVISSMLDGVDYFNARKGAIIVVGQDVRLPDALRPHATVLELPPPSFDEYRRLLERLIREYSAKMPVKVELTNTDRIRFVNNLVGLSLLEAEKVITKLIVEDGALRERDVHRVIEAKRQVVEQDGLLEYSPADAGLDQVAGLNGLKQWLGKRRPVVADPRRAEEFGLAFPKGVLLLGVPGCGKSLCARAVAREWGLPLLRLDPGNLYDKYIGDSEKNFKRAMQTAERMAPIVLWIDELEKAFASVSGDADGGVSNRIFGSFLSWLQDRTADVFVVATSNDVAKLPPEFVRKGRFDEIFFVDLPAADARAGVFGIHLKKRRQDASTFNLAQLAAATEGFSGAEIEESINTGLYAAFSEGRALTTADLLSAVSATRPLSRLAGDRLAQLRAWAGPRTVSAD